MTLLYEMGLSELIPPRIVEVMADAVNKHYLHFFPFRAEDAPPGTDFRTVMCHCALGTMYKIFYSCDLNVDESIPWAREWFMKYQMPDGGLNCDERAYLKASPKGSIVSTLPPLEAVLSCTSHRYTEQELAFLDRGAEYLIKHQLVMTSDGSRTIDESWNTLAFPRFYEYDIMRGLSFLARWAAVRNRQLPKELTDRAVAVIERQTTSSGLIKPGRRAYEGAKTFEISESGKFESQKPSSTFDLLEIVSAPGEPSPYLSNEWNEIKRLLT